MLALAMLALAPTVSRAMAWANSDVLPFAAVCSAAALGTSASTSGSPNIGSAQHDAVFEHCAFCSLQGPEPAALPGSHVVLSLARLGNAMPTGFLQAPHTSHVWVAAQARAPPQAT